MSVLFLVRHGQASFDATDYDVLSPRGEDQARALGAYWARLGMRFDRCWVGPRTRHRETHRLAAAVFDAAAERAMPAPTTLAALDEHDGQTLLHHRAGEGRPRSADPRASRRERLREFRRMMRRWARGELTTPEGLEPWPEFRRRVGGGVERVMNGAGRGQTVVVFTSGGPIACIVGDALGLADEAVMELSWWLRNGSVSELRFAPGRRSLIALNATGHLDDADLLTHV